MIPHLRYACLYVIDQVKQELARCYVNTLLLNCAFHSGAENPVSDYTPTVRPIPVVARSKKSWVCDSSLARTGGLHSAGAWLLYSVTVVCCQIEVCGSE